MPSYTTAYHSGAFGHCWQPTRIAPSGALLTMVALVVGYSRMFTRTLHLITRIFTDSLSASTNAKAVSRQATATRHAIIRFMFQVPLSVVSCGTNASIKQYTLF